MKLVSEDTRAPIDGTINLESYVEITGPYHSIGGKPVDGVTIYDRITPSNQLTGVKQIFDDATFYRDYVFGYKATGLIVDIFLVQNDKVIAKIDNAPAVNIYAIEKSANEFYFFAYVRRDLGLDQIYSIYTLDNGKTWKQASITLDVQGFRLVYIYNGPNGKFIFGGINNLQNYQAVTMLLEVQDQAIMTYTPYSHSFFDNIEDFDVVFVGGDSIIMIVGVEYQKQAEAFHLKIDEYGTIVKVGQQQISLIPNVIETHQDIVFKCNWGWNENMALYCAHSGQNLYSYLVRYDLNLANSEDSNRFIIDQEVESVFRNVVNLKPIRIDFLSNFISFMV